MGAGSGPRSPARALPQRRSPTTAWPTSATTPCPAGGCARRCATCCVFHTAELADPRERVAQARALLRFLLDGAPGARTGSGRSCATRPSACSPRSDATLLHDELAEINDAVYFHDFAAHAARHGLQYLAEADFFEMQIGAASEPAAQALLASRTRCAASSTSTSSRRACSVRRCCAAPSCAIDRTPRPEVLERLAVSTQAQPRGEPGADGAQAFAGPAGSTLTTDHPLVIDALKRAASAWPAALWVRDLSGRRRRRRPPRAVRRPAAQLRRQRRRPPCAPAAARTAPGDAPRATALARHQARAGGVVTNLRHASVRIEDDLGRRLVTLLDGTRDRAALAAELRTHLLDQARPVPDDLADSLERSLQGLARLALLES